MAIDPAIQPLLSGVEALTTSAVEGRRPIEGASAKDRLAAIVTLIGHTVLPRSFAFFVGDEPTATLTVASGRMLKLTFTDSEAPVATAPTETREERLTNIAQSLARLAQAGEKLSVETNYITSDVAAEDVGLTATELMEICAVNEWFVGQAGVDGGEAGGFIDRARKLTRTLTEFDPSGVAKDGSGDTAQDLDPALLGSMVNEITGKRDEIAALAGWPCMIVLRGSKDQSALSFAATSKGMIVATCDDANVAPLTALWAGSVSDEANTE
ncbi:MAG: hypothetical protein OEY05_10550 [Paracoccaceae bacterium]|nr:hypothetical protein [Paracoccaceae bacterium]